MNPFRRRTIRVRLTPEQEASLARGRQIAHDLSQSNQALREALRDQRKARDVDAKRSKFRLRIDVDLALHDLLEFPGVRAAGDLIEQFKGVIQGIWHSPSNASSGETSKVGEPGPLPGSGSPVVDWRWQ